ncbi:unnamed protein product [Schistocephalus solidus]|uniref:EF-hand domain-containing protein n=1 Tax=Schistocephalus solidus TaxID=70667 RepID=A0A183SAN9_SCHSO|nr:unnamed protein product [Schistocephalus solidus]
MPHPDSRPKSGKYTDDDVEDSPTLRSVASITHSETTIDELLLKPKPTKDSKREDRFDLAVSFFTDAYRSRLEIKYKRDPRSVQLYNLYYSPILKAVYYCFMVLNLLTILIEEPAAIKVNGKALPYYIPLAINVLCEAVFYCRWFHIFLVADLSKMKHNRSFIGTIVILGLMTLDDITYIIQQENHVQNPIRWSRALRPMLLLTFPENRQIRAAFDNIRCTAIDVSSVFAMFVFSLLFISIVTLKLLQGEKLMYPDGSTYFPDFGEIAWELYVLSTTSNSPDVIIPAFERSASYFTIYVWVCTMCNWLFMGILTASVYNAYKSHLGSFVLRRVVMRKSLLDEAFTLLQGDFKTAGVDRDTFFRVMRVVASSRSEKSIELIFNILDHDNTGIVDQKEFARFTEYLQMNFKEVVLSRESFAQFIPKFEKVYTTPRFQRFAAIIRSRPVRIYFDLMVLANGVTMVAANNTPYEYVFEWIFTIIFSVEIILKYVASGGVRFFTNNWNIFDIVVVAGAFVGQAITQTFEYFELKAPTSVSQFFLLLRLFRLLKLVGQIPIFKCIINCIIIILPSLCAYAAILLILFYVFTCAGMEVFGGLFRAPPNHDYSTETPCNNTNLVNTDFEKLHYCSLNFNHVANSFALLFILSVGNNWHIFSNGYAAVTNRSSRVFFLLVHWLCVLLVLNIVLAFIIEAFLIEYDPQSSKFEEYIVERLKELHFDAHTELEKRNLQAYASPDFFLTREQVDTIFPETGAVGDSVSAFYYIPDGASIELLMFRMFEDEIEAIAANYEVRPSIRARVVNL